MAKYGLVVCTTDNLGDDIQSVAAMQYLPRVDTYVFRDYPNYVNSDEPVKTIFNGWLTHRPENWPPSPILLPLYISIHIDPKISEKFLSKDVLNHFKKFEPIGCRDLNTVKILRKKGIKAYFSGCLTLTLDYKYSKYKNKEKHKNILVVDVPKCLVDILKNKVKKNEINVLTHTYSNIRTICKIWNKIPANIKNLAYCITVGKPYSIINAISPIQKRLRKAEKMIKAYLNTKLIITTRLHVALPAVAFGIPVVFLANDLTNPRFSGLLKFMHSCSFTEFKKKIDNFDLETPPENPNKGELKIIKRQLIKICKRFINSTV